MKVIMFFGALCVSASLWASECSVNIDFREQVGRSLRPVNGINNMPTALDTTLPEIKDANIPFSRTHDTGGAYGRSCFIDIPNLFPNFDADETDPKNYRFEFTDKLLRTFKRCGVKPFFRLGVTIENNWRVYAYNIHPPKDFAKWARICEYVIRHYNHGWPTEIKSGPGRGYYYNIEYWEIWNEPENPPMWTGTREQYFELYKVASRHLKEKFPYIKVGGYAGCGFYAVNREDSKKSEFAQSFVTWFDEFLKFVKKEKLPFDFYSWHLYTHDPKEIAVHSKYVREKLDSAGFDKTENIFNEWNIFNAPDGVNTWDALKTNHGASGVAAAFAVMQKDTAIDSAMYYDGMPSRGYCGLYEYPSLRTTHTYCAFKVYGELATLTNEVKSVVCGNDELYVLAAANEGKGAFYVVNLNQIPVKPKWNIKNAPSGEKSAYIIDEKRQLQVVRFDEAFELPARSILYVRYAMSELAVVRKSGVGATKIGGLSNE